MNWSLVLITLGRLLLNTGLRMMYPFLPALARGLDVPLSTMTSVVAWRNLTGFLGPVFGPLSERFGRRVILWMALLLFGVSALLAGWGGTVVFFGVMLALMNLAKMIYDPTMQAYLGDVVPYKERGKAVAVTEVAWSGAFLVGIPVVGFAIERFGWRAPFGGLAVGGLVVAVVLARVLPASRPVATTHHWRDVLRLFRDEPVVWAAFGSMCLLMMGNDILFIVYGVWMEGSFGLSLTSLGLITMVIGSAELLGDVVMGVASDRWGKKRLVMVTGVFLVGLYVVLPFVSVSLVSTFVALFVLFCMYEVTMIGMVPLHTELVPSARGIVMSLTVAAMALGRMWGVWLGPLIWEWGGLVANGVVSAGISLVALLIVARWIGENDELKMNNE